VDPKRNRAWRVLRRERAVLSKNIGVSFARFSVLLLPHRDKERFVNTIERGATR